MRGPERAGIKECTDEKDEDIIDPNNNTNQLENTVTVQVDNEGQA